MAAPTISAITTVPNRENATNQASFSNDVDTFFSEVGDFQTEANAQASYLDNLAVQVDADATVASNSASAAQGAANYKGDWTVSTNVLQGESYSYAGSTWIAKQNSVGQTPAVGVYWLKGVGTAAAADLGTGATEVPTNADVDARVSLIEAYVGGQTIAMGSATLTNSTNNIALTGIGVGVEVGDVIQITGAANAKNNSEFTVDIITDDDNIIVNQAHAAGTTSKSLVSETATVTIKLLCKWYLAGTSLGRGWVEIGATRLFNTLYQFSGKRPINLQTTAELNADITMSLTIDGVVMDGGVSRYTGAGIVRTGVSATIPPNVDYIVTVSPTNAQKFNWAILA